MPRALSLLFGVPKMATHFKEQLAQFHTSHPSWAESQQRVRNVEFSTYPLLTSMISPLEVQDELLPHRLVSVRDEEREEEGQRDKNKRRR